MSKHHPNASFFQAGEQFRDRIALVTGGTDGIGLDIALSLAAHHATVYVCGRDEKKGLAAQKLAQEQAAGKIHFIQTDLTSTSACASLVQRIADEQGKLDYLINNAANDKRQPFATADVETFESQININLRPLFCVTQAALPLIKQGQGKAICNLCTTNYMLGLVPFTLYNASKSAIIGFSRSLARELGVDDIRVNVVSPGWVMTTKQLKEHVNAQDKIDLLRDQCIKRLLEPNDVTPTVMFLLSNLAKGVTGQNLIVDHGKVMQ